MSDALVSDAQGWAKWLILQESRGPGDTENAMRRVAARYGVDFRALWALRYRPPKRIFADMCARLRLWLTRTAARFWRRDHAEP
jgi:hypothetical protein